MRKDDISGKKSLTKDFFLTNDVVSLARSLVGRRLLTSENGIVTGGMITETEAYVGTADKASHAYGGKRTARTEFMFHEGGIAYIYLCYGIHSLFNIVTNKEGIPDAVLIRGIRPEIGATKMLQRTKKKKAGKNLTNGPGKVAKALGLHYSQSGIELNKEINGFKVWVENHRLAEPHQIKPGKRIGVDYAKEDAERLYRFFV